ncbi:MAG TPA: hypothetical protein ENK86_06385 [Campylobacterales bacterium]|nr:hypothetical protein [Campylobacterales bacterium]
MVLRIELFLLVGVGLVFALLLFQDASNVDAVESNSSKELSFKNFSLIEITPQGVENRLAASEAMKYRTHFELTDVNITYQNTQHLLAKRATYRDDFITLEDSVVLQRDDGFAFETSALAYSVPSKQLHNKVAFQIDMNESRIVGENLRYDFNEKNVSADRIRAKIYFQ